MTSSIFVLFASHDGQTRRIAETIALGLARRGLPVDLRDLAFDSPSRAELEDAPLVAVAAAIRYGFHLKAADRLLAQHHDLFVRRPPAVVSVNLTARKPGKDTPEGNAYLRKWLKRRRIRPVLAAAIAGKLDYPRYSRLDRFMIRLIMTITGGPTDPAAVVEYTDWDAVDAFAGRIADHLAKRG